MRVQEHKYIEEITFYLYFVHQLHFIKGDFWADNYRFLDLWIDYVREYIVILIVSC